MYAYRLQLNALEDRLSLDNVQLSVCHFLDTRGGLVKGLAFLGLAPALADYQRVAILNVDAATRLVAFLTGVLAHRLPAAFAAEAQHGRKLRWRFQTFFPKWHDGGAFIGSVSLTWALLGPLGLATRVVATAPVLERLSVSIRKLYGLDV